MLRSVSVSHVKALLNCRYSRDFHLSSLSRTPQTNEESRQHKTSPLPPPPIKEGSTDKSPWIGLIVLALAGYGIMYAHKSPELRDMLTLHAPWLDEVIAFLYEENMTYQEFAKQLAYDLRNMIDIKKYMNILIPKREERIPERHSAFANVPDETRDQ